MGLEKRIIKLDERSLLQIIVPVIEVYRTEPWLVFSGTKENGSYIVEGVFPDQNAKRGYTSVKPTDDLEKILGSNIIGYGHSHTPSDKYEIPTPALSGVDQDVLIDELGVFQLITAIYQTTKYKKPTLSDHGREIRGTFVKHNDLYKLIMWGHYHLINGNGNGFRRAYFEITQTNLNKVFKRN